MSALGCGGPDGAQQRLEHRRRTPAAGPAPTARETRQETAAGTVVRAAGTGADGWLGGTPAGRRVASGGADPGPGVHVDGASSLTRVSAPRPRARRGHESTANRRGHVASDVCDGARPPGRPAGCRPAERAQLQPHRERRHLGPPPAPPSSHAAAAVPPVARTSSTTATRWPTHEGVGVHLERRRCRTRARSPAASVVARQLAALADRHEPARPSRQRHARAEHEPAGLDPGHDVDVPGTRTSRAATASITNGGTVGQQRRDVLEDDARLGEVGDVAHEGCASARVRPSQRRARPDRRPHRRLRGTAGRPGRSRRGWLRGPRGRRSRPSPIPSPSRGPRPRRRRGPARLGVVPLQHGRRGAPRCHCGRALRRDPAGRPGGALAGVGAAPCLDPLGLGDDRGLPLAQVHQQRGREEDRRVRARAMPMNSARRDVLERARPRAGRPR